MVTTASNKQCRNTERLVCSESRKNQVTFILNLDLSTTIQHTLYPERYRVDSTLHINLLS